MAGKGKKTFVAGEVLLAQDVNDYLMDQSVMNFATSAARASAIPTPTEGMTSYISTTGTATIPQIETYTGSAWQTPYGLTQLANADFTASAGVSVSNIFDSTYSRYRILISAFVAAGSPLLSLEFRENLTNKTTGYFGGLWQIRFDAVTTGIGMNNTNFITAINQIGVGAAGRSVVSLDLYRSATDGIVSGTGFNGSGSGSFNVGANNSTMTNFTGFTISPSSSTMTGNVKVYGYRES
jgi:hypothetical protein